MTTTEKKLQAELSRKSLKKYPKPDVYLYPMKTKKKTFDDIHDIIHDVLKQRKKNQKSKNQSKKNMICT